MQNTLFGVLLGEAKSKKWKASQHWKAEKNKESEKDASRKIGVKSCPSRNLFCFLQCLQVLILPGCQVRKGNYPFSGTYQNLMNPVFYHL